MIEAIHKLTGEKISAFRLESDASWIGRENEEWIAPRYMVRDFLEKGDAKVFFTKSYFKEDESIFVSAHFKHEVDRNIYDVQCESIEHKMAKLGIWDNIENGNIKFKDVTLKSLINSMHIEYRLGNSRISKIADVITAFKQWDPIYGKGIIFEVQFSNQNEEITSDRTFDRLAEGYSVCWLWDKDFTKDNKLIIKENGLNIIPYTKAIQQYQELIEKKSLSKINEASLLLDKKILELNKEENKFKDYIGQLKYLSDFEQNKISKANEMLQHKIDSISQNILKINENNYRVLINNSLEVFTGQIDNMIEKKKEEIINQSINKIVNSYSIENMIKEKVIGLVREELKREVYPNIIKNNPSLFEEKNIRNIIKETVMEKITIRPKDIFTTNGVIL